MSVGIDGPVGVGVNNQIWLCGRLKEKPEMECTANEPQNSLERCMIWFPRIMHMKAKLLYNVGDVQSGEGDVLKSTHTTPGIYGITNRSVVHSGHLGTSVHGHRTRITCIHASAVKYLKHVLVLR